MGKHRHRAIIASRLFPPEVGAAAFRLLALARSLAAVDIQVAVLTTNPPRDAEALADDPSLMVSRAPVFRDSAGNVRGYIQYLSFDIPLFFRLLLHRADVVIAEPPPTTGIVVAVSSWLRRRPYVYYAADVWTDGLIALGAPRFIISVMRRVEGTVMRRAAMVLAVSDEVAQKVRHFGVHDERITVVGNGVDTGTFQPDGDAVVQSGPTFVYTGIMSEWQDPSVFVKAMPAVLARYPNARLQFFGHGSEERRLISISNQLGLDCVGFGGVVAPSKVAEWLRGATAALASIKPGLGYDFAKPTKIYAAAGCGVPVIFAGRGAGAELVEENDLGWRCNHAAADVGSTMITAIEAYYSGASDASKNSRSNWVRRNASISSAGDKAAAATISVMRKH